MVQYPKAPKELVLTFNSESMGLPIKDAVEPVVAKTMKIIAICTFDFTPQRSFNFFTLQICVQNYKNDIKF